MAQDDPVEHVGSQDLELGSPEEPPSGHEREEAPPVRQSSRRGAPRPGDRPRPQSYTPRVSRRRHSDYPSNDSMRSSRPLRVRDDRWDDRDDYDDYYYDDEDRAYDRYLRDEGRHPDFFQDRRSRVSRPKPPRAHLNRPAPFEDADLPERPHTDASRAPRSVASPSTARRQPARDEEQDSPPVDWGTMTRSQRAEVLRIPWTQWMHSSVKNHFVATMGEFIGTTLFLFFAFAGTEVANIQSKANPSTGSDSNTTTGAATGFNVGVLLYISLIFGFSLMVNVWVFFRISGGLFNPAVTLAMVLVGAITAARAVCLFVAQMGGALLASVIVRFLFPENFNVRTTLGGGATVVQGVFIEAILTAELVFTIFMLAKEKHRATFIAPVGIGLALL